MIVFLHGSPNTHRLWDEVRARLPRVESRAYDLPGFGSPLPDGFGCTRWDYLEWLIGELERLNAPVDLVAHDIGAVIAHGLLIERPDLVRRWSFGAAINHADYAWYPNARIWQTTRLGEQQMQAWLGLDRDQRVAVLGTQGVPPRVAEMIAEEMDETMTRALLPFYRSALYLGDWQLPEEGLPPGQIIWGSRDPYQEQHFAEEAAERTGAELVVVDCGHWWPVEAPDEGVAALRRHLQIEDEVMTDVR